MHIDFCLWWSVLSRRLWKGRPGSVAWDMDQIWAASRAVVARVGMDALSLWVINQAPFTGTLKNRDRKVFCHVPQVEFRFQGSHICWYLSAYMSLSMYLYWSLMQQWTKFSVAVNRCSYTDLYQCFSKNQPWSPKSGLWTNIYWQYGLQQELLLDVYCNRLLASF